MGLRGVGNPPHSSLPPPRPPDPSQFKLMLQAHKEEVAARVSKLDQSMTAFAAEQEEFQRELREELRQLRLSYGEPSLPQPHSNTPTTMVSAPPPSSSAGTLFSPNYCQLPEPPPISNCKPQPQIPDSTPPASFTSTQAVINPTDTHIINATTPPQILPQIHHIPNVKPHKMKLKFGPVHQKVRIQSLVTWKRTLSNLLRPMGTHGRSSKSGMEASSSSWKSRRIRKLDDSKFDSYTGSSDSDNPGSFPVRSKRKRSSRKVSGASLDVFLVKAQKQSQTSGDSKTTWVNHRVKYHRCKSQKQILGRYYHRDYGPIRFVSGICISRKCCSMSSIMLCFAWVYEWSRGSRKLNLKHKCAYRDYNEAFETMLRVIYDKTFEENDKGMNLVLIQFDKKDFDCLWGLLVRGFKRTKRMNSVRDKLVLQWCSVLSAIGSNVFVIAITKNSKDKKVLALSCFVVMSNRIFKAAMCVFSKPGEHFVATVLLNMMEREGNIIVAFAFLVKDSSGCIKNGQLEQSWKEFGHISNEWVKEVYQWVFDNYLNILKGSVASDMVPIYESLEDWFGPYYHILPIHMLLLLVLNITVTTSINFIMVLVLVIKLLRQNISFGPLLVVKCVKIKKFLPGTSGEFRHFGGMRKKYQGLGLTLQKDNMLDFEQRIHQHFYYETLCNGGIGIAVSAVKYKGEMEITNKLVGKIEVAYFAAKFTLVELLATFISTQETTLKPMDSLSLDSNVDVLIFLHANFNLFVYVTNVTLGLDVIMHALSCLHNCKKIGSSCYCSNEDKRMMLSDEDEVIFLSLMSANSCWEARYVLGLTCGLLGIIFLDIYSDSGLLRSFCTSIACQFLVALDQAKRDKRLIMDLKNARFGTVDINKHLKEFLMNTRKMLGLYVEAGLINKSLLSIQIHVDAIGKIGFKNKCLKDLRLFFMVSIYFSLASDAFSAILVKILQGIVEATVGHICGAYNNGMKLAILSRESGITSGIRNFILHRRIYMVKVLEHLQTENEVACLCPQVATTFSSFNEERILPMQEMIVCGVKATIGDTFLGGKQQVWFAILAICWSSNVFLKLEVKFQLKKGGVVRIHFYE